jgi:DNA-binding MarR family transcriptional regulator
MDPQLRSMIDTFLKILHTYSAIEKKPKDLGTGDLLYVSEIHAISIIGKNPEINLTRLADISGVTRGAISQIVKRLISKRYIARYNTRNNKEINLRLSDKGYLIFLGITNFEKEMFAFAEQIYKDATPADRELVNRLFNVIYENTRKILDNF